MELQTPTDLITVKEARALLGVGTPKMAKLLREGVLKYYPNPLDARVKLVSKAAVLALIPSLAEAA